MSKRLIYSAILAVAFTVPALPGPCHAQTVRRPTQKQDQAIRKFLVGYLGPPYLPFEKGLPTRYYAALVGLSAGAARDVIVYLTGRAYCGTGGCTTLVLAPKGPSYKVVSRLTITTPPIKVLPTMSHGWHDIEVYVSGGATSPGYEARLKFDGKSYPTNPSVQPPERSAGSQSGRTAIPRGASGKLLYRR